MKNPKTKASKARLAICLFLIFVFIASTVGASSVQQTTSQVEETTKAVSIPADEAHLFELFSQIKDFIQKHHTKDVSKEALYQGAIKGMLEAVDDPYSRYLTNEEFRDFTSSLEGEYAGIGITIELVQGNIVVVSTFKNSPAEKAGVKPGDIIIGADGKDLRGKTHVDAAKLLRGPEGTEVTVDIKRPSTGETLSLKMVRSIIKPPTLDLQDLGDGIYYIEISRFTSDTRRDFQTIINYLRMKNIKGLILDLRNNPGGILDSCIEVAEELVPKGPIVELRRKASSQVIENKNDTVPILTVVLVNNGTASAAEILAGAIKDRGVGILVGEPTFGKAFVQTVVPLGEDMGGMRLTIADYYTPSGKSISGKGLEPDVKVKPKTIQIPEKIPYNRPLKKGFIGLDVLSLQESLNFLGYDVGEPDGIFGQKTQRAWTDFCKSHNLQCKDHITDKDINMLYLAVLEKVRNAPDVVFEKGLEILKQRIDTGAWQ